MKAVVGRVILAAATLLTFAATGVSSLQCYQCDVNRSLDKRLNTQKRLCSHFDYSEDFVVECPDSTMCMKKDFKLQIQNGVTIQGMIRDCASQRNEVMDFVSGRWVPKVEIIEPYEEGCRQDDDRGEKATTSRECYCRGNLCNSAPKTSYHEGYTDIMGVIVVFNLTKYINSLR